MSSRKERLELVRITLSNAANTLLTNTSPCGPFILDIECAQEILGIIHKLGAEENAQVQLDKADEVLGWHGTGQGRIDRIKQLRRNDD